MNSRERFLTALDHKEPDYVPITDLALDPPIVDAILQKHKVRRRIFGNNVYSTHGIAGRGDAWKAALDYRVAMIEAYKKLGFDAIPALSDKVTTKAYKPKFIDEKKFIDQWGRVMQTSIENKTTYFVGGTVNTPEDLENYEPPDAFHPDVVEMLEKIFEHVRDEPVAKIATVHSGWTIAFEVRGGIDKILVDFYRNPGFANKILQKSATACRRFAEVLTEFDLDALFVTDDYADNHGPFMSPKMFREYELPNLKKIVEIGKKRGMPVLFHSDGNIYPILDDIVSAGVDGLHPIELGTMDLGDVKERYGERLCLFGNVDCRYVLPYGNEEDVRKDVRRCIDAAGRGGGYVLTSSNSIHANVRVENVYTMVDEARRYGRYPLKHINSDSGDLRV
jgi:uroporphyrinogen-III decarboxylase